MYRRVFDLREDELTCAENIAKAVASWKELTKSLHNPESYRAFTELYDLLRKLRLSHNRTTLTAADVRLALNSLRRVWLSSPALASAGPQRLFFDLPDVWRSPWTHEDYAAVFEALKVNKAVDESLATMKTIHQMTELEEYPDAECWTKVLESQGEQKSDEVVRMVKDTWAFMRQCDVKPNISTFNALFGLLHSYPKAFDFIVQVYQDEFIPSNLTPPPFTLRCLLESYMTQPPEPEHIVSGNEIFEQLLDLKSGAAYDPQFWEPVIKWLLYRGESLQKIKHTMYEQSAALGRSPRKQLPTQETGLSRTYYDDTNADAITHMLDQLVELALRTRNVKAAKTIYDDFFPALGVSHTATTDELQLEILIQSRDPVGAKSLYDDLRFQGHQVSATTSIRLLETLATNDTPLPLEAQAVFFDLLDSRDPSPETHAMAFEMLANLLLRIGDYPRMRQTLRDRLIDRVPNWRNTLSSISLDIISSPQSVWLEPILPVYHIVQKWAPETITLSHRHVLMEKLISHGRTDLGMELFHDMRHSDISQPTKETYALLLTGCAKTRDAQTLTHVHSALRLDSSIEPDANLLNSLMKAYNRTRLPEKAIAIWEVLSASAVLPDVETASLALDSCSRIPRYGLIRAREIWTYMEDNNIEPTSASYAALLNVFASVGKWDGMIGLLARMDKDKVNAQVLGTAYNSMRRDRKDEVEQWARENKPDVWEYLESIK